MKNRISKNFHVPLNSLSSVKTAKSSPARGHMGGADWGYLELGPGDPRHGLGGPYTRKKIPRDPGPNTHTIRKEILTPPPKRGTQVRGGGVRGSKSKKSLGYHFWS